jgi:hypothetical protein
MHAVSGGWGIEMGYLKIVVKIPDTIYPELVADLDRVQLRDRAERIRLLAMIGLRTLAPHPNTSMTNSQGADHTRDDHPQNTRTMIRNLMDSL